MTNHRLTRLVVTKRNRSVLLKTRHSLLARPRTNTAYFTSKNSTRFQMRFLAKALLLFIASACFPSRGQACCDEGWLTYGRNCYFFNHDASGKADWNEAADVCRLLGGHLVDIRSEGEWQFVKSHLRRGTGPHWEQYLIGMNDKAQEGSWKYSDGSTASFLKWKSGEPNGGRKENCGGIFTDSEKRGLYNDAPCGYKMGKFICKKAMPQ